MKVHIQDAVTKADKYLKSPHVSGAITKGLFALCGVLSPTKEFITNDIEKATCKGCIALYTEDDSTCPTCGEDGGTSCGAANCGLLTGEAE